MSKGGFASYSRGKREPSEKPELVEGEEDTGDGVDEEEEEDGEGADASSLLMDAYAPIRSTTTWSAICSSRSASLFQRSTLLDTPKLAYAEKVQEVLTTQPTLAAPTTTEVSSESPLVQGWALKGIKKATRFNENQRQNLNNKFQIGQESGHKANPEKVLWEMCYA